MTFHPTRTATRLLAWSSLWLAALPGAHAGEAYVNVGFPGVMAGYAQAVTDMVTLRGDFATMGSRGQDGVEEGIEYKGTFKANRVGLFADYFPLGNSFRLTGGVTFNNVKIDLKSNFQTGTVDIGGTPVPVSNTDYFNVQVKFPKTTPYLGIGWGHLDQAPGWGLVADLGVSIGKAKVSIDTNLKDKGVTQEEIDRETQEIRDGVGKLRVLPQASLGVSYRY